TRPPRPASAALASGCRALRRRLAVARAGHQQQLDLARVGAQDLEAQAVELDALAAPGHPAELPGDEAADGVEVALVEPVAEHVVELGDLGDRAHPVALLAGNALDREDVVALLVEVELVLDVADDLLEDVLDRHQARHAAVLVDHDREMVAV